MIISVKICERFGGMNKTQIIVDCRSEEEISYEHRARLNDN